MIKLYNNDCLQQLKELADNSVDSIITDPPYELGFMGKSWDNTGIANNKEMWAECLRVLKHGGHLLAFGGTRTYHRMACAIEDAGFEVRDMIEWVYSTGFPKSLNVNKALQKKCTCGNMGAYEKERTEKVSKHNLRLMSSPDLSATINDGKKCGEVLQSGLSEQSSYGAMQRKESEEGFKNGKESSLEGGHNLQETKRKLQGGQICEVSEGFLKNGKEGRIHNAAQVNNGSTPKEIIDEDGSCASQGSQPEQQQNREPCSFCNQWGAQKARRTYEETKGVGTALKPAHEPICMARKPLAEKTVAENVLKWGTGGINIDESRVEAHDGNTTARKRAEVKDTSAPFGKGYEMGGNGSELGRFPANLITDGSDEVKACFPDSGAGKAKHNSEITRNGISQDGSSFNTKTCGFDVNKCQGMANFGDSGNASRFFKSIIYQAKASKSDRNEGCEGMEEKEGIRTNAPRENEDIKTPTRTNNHPTVKPTALMQYLIKMITPKGGIVLDPFMGSGSTGKACIKDGFSFIGIEKEEEYFKIAEARILTKNKQLKF